MAEAKKRVSNIDIKAFQRKAKKYVKEKNFSDEANEQMRLYNLAMKVNRLELLKANIGLELVAGHDELKSYTGDKLEGAYLEEIKRNASILGDTVIDNAKMAKTVADSSFKNATFFRTNLGQSRPAKKQFIQCSIQCIDSRQES